MEQQLGPHNHRLWVAYRHDLRIRNLSPQTVRNYFETLDSADRYFSRSFLDLTRLDIKAYLADKLETLAATTVQIHFVGLRVFYNFLVREQLLPASPLQGLKAPEVEDVPPRIIPESDLKSLLKSCSGTSFRDRRDNALFRLLLEPGGCRRAEIIGLGVDSLDLDNDIIKVFGKGRKTRFITYGANTGQALFRYMHVRAKHRDSSSDALWLGKYGPLTIYALAQILRSRCIQAGIQKIRPHECRHTSADRAMSAGISDTDMMTLYGWSTPRMLQVYGRSNKIQRALESAKRVSLGDRL